MNNVILYTENYKLNNYNQYSKSIETLYKNYNQVYFTNTYKDWKVDYKNVEVINFIS